MKRNQELYDSLSEIYRVLEKSADIAKENQKLSIDLNADFPPRPLESDAKYRRIYCECYRSSLKHENEEKVEREPLKKFRFTSPVGMPTFLFYIAVSAYAFLSYRYYILQISDIYSQQLASSPILGPLESLNQPYPNYPFSFVFIIALAVATILRAKEKQSAALIMTSIVAYGLTLFPPSCLIPAVITSLVICLLINKHRKARKQKIERRNDERNQRYEMSIADARSRDEQLAQEKAQKLVDSVLWEDKKKWALKCKDKLAKQAVADQKIRDNVRKLEGLQHKYFELITDDDGEFWFPTDCGTLEACSCLKKNAEYGTLTEKTPAAIWASWQAAKPGIDVDKLKKITEQGFSELQKSVDLHNSEIRKFMSSFEDGMVAISGRLEEISAGQSKTQQQIDDAIDQIDRGLEHAYALSMTAMTVAERADYKATMAQIDASIAFARTL